MRRTKLVPYSHNLNQFLTGFSYFLASLLTESRRASVVAGMAFKYFLASLLTESRRASVVAGMAFKYFLASLLTESRRASVVAGMAFKYFLASLLTESRRAVECGFIQHVADLSSTSALQGWISA